MVTGTGEGSSPAGNEKSTLDILGPDDSLLGLVKCSLSSILTFFE